MVTPGTLLDRFRIEAELGEGGMGTVYRAHDTRLNRRVALKIIRAEANMSAEAWSDAKARLLREARAAAAFDHPNVVSIYDLGESSGVPFIAMELVPGKTLRSFEGPGRAPWPEKLRWLLDAANALAAAHRAGLVHRDIKPENIMVREDGRVKVLDFGIARRATMDLGASAAHATGALTGNGRLVGTPLYMAPEYIMGKKLDGCADQFAWGVTAFELFAGRPPWDADDTVALMAAVLLQPPPSLRAIVPELPGEVEAAIVRAMAKDPADRHASMEALVEVLEPLAAARVRSPSIPSANAVSGGSIIPVSGHASSTTATPLVSDSARVARGSRAKAVMVTVVVAAALTSVGVWRHFRVEAVQPALSTETYGSVVTKPISTNAEAATAYRAGLQAMRDASINAARQRFDQSTKLDSSLAAAHLRLSPLLLFLEPTSARGHFQKATELRASLDEHDQALLDGLEPLVGREPSDDAEAERRLAQAAARFPLDSEIAYFLSVTRTSQGRFAEAAETIDHAVAADAKSALSWYQKAVIEGYGGTHDGAVRALDRCLELAPTATSCLQRRMLVEELDGKCADAERDGKRWVAATPESVFARRWLAEASFGAGKSRDTVEEHLKQAWANDKDVDDKNRTEMEDLATLDELSGQFSSAEKHLRDLERASASSPDLYMHVLPARALLQLYRETGDLGREATVANEFLRRKDAWVSDPGSNEFAVEMDVTPPMLDALRRKGTLSPAQFHEKLEAWTKSWEERMPRAYFGYAWIRGYAGTANTREDAEAALAALPSHGPLSWYRPGLMADALVGRVYLLAGRVDEALPVLEHAAGSCRAFDDPTGWVQVHTWLGAAREKHGDIPGACTEYRSVLARWSAAPASRSAHEARARIAALRCAP